MILAPFSDAKNRSDPRAFYLACEVDELHAQHRVELQTLLGLVRKAGAAT